MLIKPCAWRILSIECPKTHRSIYRVYARFNSTPNACHETTDHRMCHACNENCALFECRRRLIVYAVYWLTVSFVITNTKCDDSVWIAKTEKIIIMILSSAACQMQGYSLWHVECREVPGKHYLFDCVQKSLNISVHTLHCSIASLSTIIGSSCVDHRYISISMVWTSSISRTAEQCRFRVRISRMSYILKTNYSLTRNRIHYVTNIAGQGSIIIQPIRSSWPHDPIRIGLR